MEQNLLEVAFHWPHDRLALGFDIAYPDEEFDYTTVRIFLGICTITYNNV